ncbi:MAG: hypothetical protein WCW93_01295 [Candidatus Paceibacterota bacterium]
MSLIQKNLDKNNLHHAYLIEGERSVIVKEIEEFLKSLGVSTIGNPDFIHIQLDSFKIEDARNLKSYANQKSFSLEKKIFIISANNFLLEAQNSLLKIFEEPIENTHFFLIVPDVNSLLKTLVSRFYLISTKQDIGEVKEVEKFITMPLKNRIDFIKELLTTEDEEDEEGNEIIVLNSTRSKALRFLNALESVLYSKFIKNFSGFTLPGVPGGTYAIQNSLQICFPHFFKVREFLRMPGSSVKSLMKSVAIVTPNFKN